LESNGRSDVGSSGTCPTLTVSSLNFGVGDNVSVSLIHTSGDASPCPSWIDAPAFDDMLLMQMKFHGQNLESVYKEIPMRLLPVEYLPDDYKGPNAGTEKELIGINGKTFSVN